MPIGALMAHLRGRPLSILGEPLNLGPAAHFPAAPEDELLIECARSRTDDAKTEAVKQLVARNISWDYIVKASIENRISSLLYEHLLPLGDGAVPRDIMNRLRMIRIHTIAHNLHTKSESLKLLAALKRKGIAVILLKGAALELILEHDMYHRPKSDIDVLVLERDFRGIEETLSGLAYRLSPTLPDLNEREIVEYAHYFDQIKFFTAKRMKIDCHFRLINMGLPADDERIVWNRSVRMNLCGVPALVPSFEDMLLHLCFHANHHRFAKLYYFCDIDRLIGHCADRLEWDYFVEASGQRHIHASMYYALLLTSRLLGSRLPETVLQRLRPRKTKQALFEIIWVKGMNHRKRRLRLGSFEGPIYSLLEMDGLKSKARFACKILFPPRKWLSHRYQRPESIALSFKYLLELPLRCRRAIEYEGR